MKIPRIYFDTSVIGGCFDEEFQVWSNALVDDLKKGLFQPVISSIVTEEIQKAPEQVRKKLEELIQLGAEILEPNQEALDLMKEYQKRNIISDRFKNDLLHIAIATISAEVLVSWNFKHIVKLDKVQQFNAVNLSCGYRAITIYSPREVAHYEED